jgi:hypothetical protein
MIQTLSLIAAVVLCIVYVGKAMGLDFSAMCSTIANSEMSRIWFFDDVNDKQFFFKQFFAGMFTTIAMTGLDQDMMQKNLSCKNLKEAQKNVVSYGFSFLPVNLLFLSLGVLLYEYATKLGMFSGGNLTDISGNPLKADELFAYLATSGNFLPQIVGLLFIIGLVAAAFSSAGSAVTALTTSVTIDILNADKKQDETALKKTRFIVHIINSVLMGVLICLFSVIGNNSVIDAVYVVASYTYGPLLGLYLFGLYTKKQVKDKFVPIVCVLSPILCLIFSLNSEAWFNGYKTGYELLLYNAGLTFLGLLALRKKE